MITSGASAELGFLPEKNTCAVRRAATKKRINEATRKLIISSPAESVTVEAIIGPNVSLIVTGRTY